jgi:hypothetical protein
MPYKPKYPVYDPHVHIMGCYDDLDGFMTDCRRLYTDTDVEGYAILCLSSARACAGQAPAQLLAKLLNPGKIRAYGGFAYHFQGLPFDRAGLLAQIKDMHDTGFDGLKMWEGKPVIRKEYGIPLDSEIFDDAFDFMEEKGTHIIYHVADPALFWDSANDPKSMTARGWDYSDGTYTGKDELHAEIDRMLKKHPRLNVTFAHYNFMADELERLGDFLDQNPSVTIDVCPGPRMFYFLQKDLQKSRDFFIRYQDRILYGTDNQINDGRRGDAAVAAANRGNSDIFRFMELSEEYTPEAWNMGPLCGIGLDGEPLKKVYKLNYERIHKGEQKTDIGKAIAYCEKRLATLEKNTDLDFEGVKKQIREVIARMKKM